MFLLKEKPNIHHVRVDEEQSSKTGKPVGEYITLVCGKSDDDEQITDDLAQIISEMLSNLCGETNPPKYLVAGLGNHNITPDSLGVRVAGKVLATAHLSEQPEFDELGLNKVCVFTPRVTAQTGIESAEQLSLIAAGIKPYCLIVVDSLACDSLERLAKTIQITDTEIFPGSGLGNNRRKISRETLGFPIIAIGVPTVVCLSDDYKDALVPRDIDMILARFSKIISNAINKALNPTLSYEDVHSLIWCEYF
jgi:spore protease